MTQTHFFLVRHRLVRGTKRSQSQFAVGLETWSTIGTQNGTLANGLPLKTPRIGEVLIFYRHIAHVTQKVEKLCF